MSISKSAFYNYEYVFWWLLLDKGSKPAILGIKGSINYHFKEFPDPDSVDLLHTSHDKLANYLWGNWWKVIVEIVQLNYQLSEI